MRALQRLASQLREQGGLVSTVVLDPDHQPDPGFGAQVAAGPRAAGREQDYETLIEAIYEGYLLHYGEPRIVRTDDVDLRLLAGDQLYALGLARLVEIGDLAAVRELSDVISLTALAHAAGDARLAGAVWQAGARAVGYGSGEEHARAKALARAGAPQAAQQLELWGTVAGAAEMAPG